MAERKKVTLPTTRTKGLECPRCGCQDLRCASRWLVFYAYRRRRICRNCGYPVYTTEQTDELPPSEANGD